MAQYQELSDAPALLKPERLGIYATLSEPAARALSEAWTELARALEAPPESKGLEAPPGPRWR